MAPSPPLQAMAHANSASAVVSGVLARTLRLGRRSLLRDPLRVRLQTPDAVELAEIVLLLAEVVGLLHHARGLVVVARVFVGEAQVPVSVRELLRADLGVSLRRGESRVERLLGLAPVAALGIADAPFELGDVGILDEARVDVLLMRNDGLDETLEHGAPRVVRERVAVDGRGA